MSRTFYKPRVCWIPECANVTKSKSGVCTHHPKEVIEAALEAIEAETQLQKAGHTRCCSDCGRELNGETECSQCGTALQDDYAISLDHWNAGNRLGNAPPWSRSDDESGSE